MFDETSTPGMQKETSVKCVSNMNQIKILLVFQIKCPQNLASQLKKPFQLVKVQMKWVQADQHKSNTSLTSWDHECV